MIHLLPCYKDPRPLLPFFINLYFFGKTKCQQKAFHFWDSDLPTFLKFLRQKWKLNSGLLQTLFNLKNAYQSSLHFPSSVSFKKNLKKKLNHVSIDNLVIAAVSPVKAAIVVMVGNRVALLSDLLVQHLLLLLGDWVDWDATMAIGTTLCSHSSTLSLLLYRYPAAMPDSGRKPWLSTTPPCPPAPSSSPTTTSSWPQSSPPLCRLPSSPSSTAPSTPLSSTFEIWEIKFWNPWNF